MICDSLVTYSFSYLEDGTVYFELETFENVQVSYYQDGDENVIKLTYEPSDLMTSNIEHYGRTYNHDGNSIKISVEEVVSGRVNPRKPKVIIQ